MAIKELVKRTLIWKENRRYQKQLAEKKATYGEWLARQEKLWRAEPAREGQDDAAADFVLVCVGNGELTSYAEENIARYFKQCPEIQVLYGDEDVLTCEGEHAFPWFKPDWSPDLLDGCFYFGSLIAVRRQLWDETRKIFEEMYPGRWQRIFGEETQKLYRVEDLESCEKWLHVCVREGYEKNCGLVGHIPQILFHAKSDEDQQKFLRQSEYLAEKRRRLMADFSEECAEKRDGQETLVSIVIPSKDQPELLGRCIESARNSGADIPYEIIVVDNGSSEEHRDRIGQMLKEAKQTSVNGRLSSFRYLYQPMDFNFSKMCNMGAAEAKGKLLLFLNDDVELEDDCIAEMAARALRPYTGAVGMKLLYPNSALIQHDGIVNLPVGPVHKLQFHEDNKCYYYGRNRFDWNCVAVTGACLMIGAEKFREAGGFKETLRVAYNDVELGFGLVELGYQNVVVNACHARHYESLSRGSDESPEKQRRLEEERALLYQMHPRFWKRDPYYPLGLNREGLDSRIVPEYVSFKNKVQRSGWKPFPYEAGKLRRDECLMARVETSGPERIQGYSVVLGDNNACYDKYLLLLPERSKKKFGDGTGDGADSVSEGKSDGEVSLDDTGNWLCMKTEGQYRQDLEENLPDQVNVAMGGFCVSREGEELPSGNYRIAVLAVNRVSGLKLWNESGKSLTINV